MLHDVLPFTIIINDDVHYSFLSISNFLFPLFACVKAIDQKMTQERA